MLYEKLPRELRDEIYGYVMPWKYVHVHAPEDDFRHYSMPLEKQISPGIDPRYVGKAVARELAEHSYRTMQIRTRDEYHGMTPEYRSASPPPAWVSLVDQHGLVRADLVRDLELPSLWGSYVRPKGADLGAFHGSNHAIEVWH
jgi:hypothetical protein